MGERFERLYALEPNLYSKGCPVIIEAGALLKDTESGNVLVQIKMRNIDSARISSCRVSVAAFATNGDEVEGVRDFSYLDLNARAGQDFGSKVPIMLSDKTARRFTVDVNEIVFSDGTVKKISDNHWRPLPAQKDISEVFQSRDLIEQYKIEAGEPADLVPEKKEGLFLCTCGAANLESAEKCYKCGKSYDQLMKYLDTEYLSLRCEERKRQEAIDKNNQEQKKKKLLKIAAVLAGVIIIIIAAVNIFNMIQTGNSVLPEKVSWNDTYEKVEKKLGSDAEKHPVVRYLDINDIKHLGYHARARFAFAKETDLLREITVFFDENKDTIEKVLTKEYGDPQNRQGYASFETIEWVYDDTIITLSNLGSYSCCVRYNKSN